ncbi:MAG: sodium-dependent transporter, partial [Holophagales bacterium]|nr:sodium-dependent transporter [Holophagales bacterium]
MANGSGGRGRFGQLGFIFAAVGSAIGLGNIWKFPYITYANDGGSFVLVYLVAIVLICLPIMMAELIIGRITRQSPVGAFVEAARGAIGGRAWGAVGALGTLGSFILLSYYALIAGWTVYYFGQCLSWSFRGFDTGGQTLGDSFGAFLGNGPLQIGFHALFMAVTVGVVALGVQGGIERVAKTLMPVLGAILI